MRASDAEQHPRVLRDFDLQLADLSRQACCPLQIQQTRAKASPGRRRRRLFPKVVTAVESDPGLAEQGDDNKLDALFVRCRWCGRHRVRCGSDGGSAGQCGKGKFSKARLALWSWLAVRRACNSGGFG